MAPGTKTEHTATIRKISILTFIIHILKYSPQKDYFEQNRSSNKKVTANNQKLCCHQLVTAGTKGF
jgi:hypothetical protein